jgi:hypothetical protein
MHVYTKHVYTATYVYMYVNALYMSTWGGGYYDIGILAKIYQCCQTHNEGTCLLFVGRLKNRVAAPTVSDGPPTPGREVGARSEM